MAQVAYQYLVDGKTKGDYNVKKLKPFQTGIIAGFTYSWKYMAISIAVEDYLLDEQSDGASRYGTFTLVT